MALRAKWTLRLEGVQTQLAFGAAAQADAPQPLQVSLVINGLTPDTPFDGADCLDHETICRWIVDEWPKSAATPLLETRVNELLDFIFGFDKRVQDAWVGLYRSGLPGGAARIGVERQVSRSQVQARSRMSRA
jgi:dihydroneopterin aldolase